MSDTSGDLTKGKISLKMIQLAAPMTIGILAVMSVALVDTYFISKLGTAPLTAISFSFPVTLTITSLSIGLGAGASSMVSRIIGEGNREQAKRVTTHSIILGIVLVILICTIGFLTIRPLFSVLGASGESLDLIVRYMRIWYISMPFLIIPMVANAVIRSVGDAFWPSFIMVSSAIINIALTPLLIFGGWIIPAMDIEGAAVATLIARALTLVLSLSILIFREKLIEFCLPDIKTLAESFTKIVKIAGPVSLGNMVNPLGITLVTSILATFGEPTVAAFGVATRIESFASIPMLALSSAIGPVCGQNWGAGKRDRIVDALKFSFVSCLVWSLVAAAILYVLSQTLAQSFSPDDDVARRVVTYLIIVPVSLWGYGVIIVSAGAFNAVGNSVTGLGVYLLRTAALYVPVSWLVSIYLDSTAVFIGIAICNAIAGILAATFSLYWFGKRAEECKTA